MLGLTLLGGAFVAASCATVPVEDREVMPDDQFLKNAQVTGYDHDADLVWLRVKETVVHLSSRQPQFNDERLRAFASVDGGSIQVGVFPNDGHSCRLAVRARQYGILSDSLAKTVLARIHDEIESR